MRPFHKALGRRERDTWSFNTFTFRVCLPHDLKVNGRVETKDASYWNVDACIKAACNLWSKALKIAEGAPHCTRPCTLTSLMKCTCVGRRLALVTRVKVVLRQIAEDKINPFLLLSNSPWEESFAVHLLCEKLLNYYSCQVGMIDFWMCIF